MLWLEVTSQVEWETSIDFFVDSDFADFKGSLDAEMALVQRSDRQRLELLWQNFC